MKVYVLLISTYSDNAYCDWEWQCEGVYASEAEATKLGYLHINNNPGEAFSVEEHDVKGL